MIGRLSDLGAKRWILALFVFQFVVVIAAAAWYGTGRSSEGCLYCHASTERMQEAGAPWLTVTAQQAEKESRHRGVRCHECHLGNGRSRDADEAHEGMLRPLYIDFDSRPVSRKDTVKVPLLPAGDDRMRSMLPKKLDADGDPVDDSPIRNVLYHDRNPETLGYDPEIGKKACGRRGCHPEQVRQFERTVMGANLRQRTMETWVRPYGPQNCGPSFADTPPRPVAVGDRFAFENQQAILEELNVGFSREQAVTKQRYCNVCHAGCLDCHYTPFTGNGAHSFSRVPPSESCSGGGRGSSVCHAGSMERRRGDSYLGADFSEPPDMTPDVHVAQKIVCVDCHITGPGGMGDIQRKAVCSDCHLEAERALAESVHREVACEACHVEEVTGYQLTHWGPGEVAGEPNPFKKYSLYYGTFTPPVVMKGPTGKWIPVKAWPHSLANYSKEVSPDTGIRFRWPEGETRDAYAMLGTFDGLPANNLHLAWIEIEQVAHPFGKSRSCDSCHGEAQTARSEWTFLDEGAEIFSGTYRVRADGEGLRIFGIEADEPIEVEEGARLIDFAPWLYLGDIWKVRWDFSVPGKGYGKEKDLYEKGVGYLKHSARAGDKEDRKRKRFRELILHNPELGFKELENPPSEEIRLIQPE